MWYFDIWEKTNAGGKGSGQYDFTSLLGSDKMWLLREPPGKLSGVIQPDTVEVVKHLWENFGEMYSKCTVTCTEPCTEMSNYYFSKGKNEWVNLFNYEIKGWGTKGHMLHLTCMQWFIAFPGS